MAWRIGRTEETTRLVLVLVLGLHLSFSPFCPCLHFLDMVRSTFLLSLNESWVGGLLTVWQEKEKGTVQGKRTRRILD